VIVKNALVSLQSDYLQFTQGVVCTPYVWFTNTDYPSCRELNGFYMHECNIMVKA